MTENSNSSVNKSSEAKVASAGTASPSGADYGSTGAPGGMLGSMAPLLLMLLAFYFLLMRPQQKREAKRREMIGSVKKGDKIVAAGGIIGVVHKIIDDKEISLEISEDVRMKVLKGTVTEVLKVSDADAASLAVEKKAALSKKSQEDAELGKKNESRNEKGGRGIKNNSNPAAKRK